MTLTPVGDSGRGSILGASVVYPNTQAATDTVVKPTATGFQLDAALRSVSSLQRLVYRVGAPRGFKLVLDRGSGAVRVPRGHSTLATIVAPSAVDAAGISVPARMSVVGHTVVVSVAHRSGSYLYPIEVDPELNENQLAKTSSEKRSNWKFESTNETKFGHKEVYEGSGKERLETTGTAQYGTGDLPSGITQPKAIQNLRVKTKTSAKNKGAKIESVLEFQTGTTRENQKRQASPAQPSTPSQTNQSQVSN